MSGRRLIPLLLAAAGAAACGGPDCPPKAGPSRPAVEVVAGPFEAKVRTDLDFAGIARLGGKAAGDGKLQGLTVVEHRLAYRTRLALSRRLFRTRSCAELEKATVDLTPGSAVIYVPSEYEPESCPAREILAHERDHEHIHRQALEASAARMREALAAADSLPGPGRPIEVGSMAEAEKKVHALLDELLDPLYKEFNEGLAREQAVIDLPENYRWVRRRCPDWK